MSTTAPTEKPNEQDTWDEAQIQDALAHLEALQNKLDGLRNALPNLLLPLSSQQQNSRQRMLAGIQKAAVESTNAVKDLRQEWTADKTKAILSKTEQSLAANSDLSRAGETSAWGWSQSQV